MRSEFAVAYSPRAASLAFNPPCGERVVYRAVRNGALKVTKIGKRNYIMRDDLIRAATEGKLQ